MNYHLPAILWAIFIFLLTLLPGKYMAPVSVWDIANLDKLAHLAVFAVLIALLLRGVLRQRAGKTLPLAHEALAFIACAAYGLLLEGLQATLTADRLFEWQDAAANALGCFIGALVFRLVLQKRIIAARTQ